MHKLEKPLLFFLIGVAAVGPLALNGVLPATTAVIADLATRYEVVQLVLTIFLVANLFSQLVLGPAADKYGRRPVMLFSLSIFILGSVICAAAVSIEMLLAGRFVQGVGGAVCVFLPRTIVRDIYLKDKAASMIGYMTTAMMIAPLFGPAVGGWITDNTSWRFIYIGLASLASVLLLASWRFQSETLGNHSTGQKPRPSSSLFSASAELLQDKGFLACTCMLAGAAGVYYGFLSGAPYMAMKSLGMSASSYGIWFAMVAVGYLSGNLTAGRFSEVFGVEKMIMLGFIPFLAGVTLFWVLLPLHHPVGLFLPMMVVAFSNGMSLPSMITLAMSYRPELAASASALAGSVQTAVGVTLSVAIGYLLPSADVWLFVLLSLSALISLLGASMMHRRRAVTA